MTKINHKLPDTWIITEGIAGTENQCIGVTEALGIFPKILRISLSQPWNALSPWIGFEQNFTFSPKLEPPWPDLLIASGRKSITACRYIQKMSLGKTYVVYLQDPRINPKEFDLVAVPEHDPTRAQNVIVTTAAPNRISESQLKKARENFAPLFEPLPSPRIALLIGGKSKAYTMPHSFTEDLKAQILPVNGSFMVTASRRTGEENTKALKAALQGKNHYFWDGTGDNPYFGMLAWADFIAVTQDSVSMISEAATTGKPVYTLPMNGGSKRFDRFHKNMEEKGIIKPFTGNLEKWGYNPLNDAEIVADAIKERLDFTS